MSSHVTVDRLQFALTTTFHYLFPTLTMGLALFIAYLKTVSYLGREDHRFRLLRKTEAERESYESAARFWAKIFAVNFAFGVVTGIPLEFQFGTNWAQFSNYAGGVIGQTLAMEGVFAFFAESVFLGVFLAGRGRMSPRVHWISALFVFAGSWLSGFFIIATNAWMQHPVAYSQGPNGNVQLDSFWGLVTNSWLPWQYLHNMGGAAITGAFVLAAMGAFFLLIDRHHTFARLSVRVGVVSALIFTALQVFPTGDRSAHNVAVDGDGVVAARHGSGGRVLLLRVPHVLPQPAAGHRHGYTWAPVSESVTTIAIDGQISAASMIRSSGPWPMTTAVSSRANTSGATSTQSPCAAQALASIVGT